MNINDSTKMELELNEGNTIILKKNHPLEIDDNLFEEIPPFNDKEIKTAKKSLFPFKL